VLPLAEAMSIVPSAELIRRTVDTELAYTLSRMRVLERLPGNVLPLARGA